MKLNTKQVEWIKVHEKNRCSRCGNDRDSKLLTCQGCTQSERIRKLKYRNDKVSKGLCPYCMAPAKDGYVTCNNNFCAPSRRTRI